MQDELQLRQRYEKTGRRLQRRQETDVHPRFQVHGDPTLFESNMSCISRSVWVYCDRTASRCAPSTSGRKWNHGGVSQ